jgi:prolyl oligopeptidase
MRCYRHCLLLLCATPGLLTHGAGAALPSVPTPIRPVTDVYHGVSVTDNYRWLEDGAAPEVRTWTAAQNTRTRDWLDATPLRDALAADLKDLAERASDSYSGLTYRPGKNFLLRFRPPAQQPKLVVLKSLSDAEHAQVVFDPNQFDPSGGTSMDWYVPSPDGSVVALCLSRNGSEDGTLHFFETATGRKLADEMPRVQFPTAGGSAVWTADGKGLFYTRYPHVGERPAADLAFYQQIWFHRLGTPASADTYALGKEFPRIALVDLSASRDHKQFLASVANGDGGDYAHWLRGTNGVWTQLTRFEDGVKAAVFGRSREVFLLSRQAAPRGKVLKLAPGETRLSAATLAVPEGEAVIEVVVPARDGLYLREMLGGPSQIRWLPNRGKAVVVPLSPVSAVQDVLVRSGNELTFRSLSFRRPYAYSKFDPATGKVSGTALSGRAVVDFSDIEVTRDFAVSKDGTRVPLTILHRKGLKLNGRNPTWLTGYGGYGISLAPRYDPARRLWFDAGGVFAVANLRGGGEYGEEWHKAGNLTKKQNVFDDFIACAEFLIQRRYTQPSKLAIQGGSNGGLLMGAVLTQRPALFRAVVAQVGVLDMLRVELDPNGAFNTTEFGTVKDPAQFAALFAYSPYHRVTNGVPYPAVFLSTGENDGRVNPANTRKMTARLQAATSSPRPILMRTSAKAGHGIGSSLSEVIAERADVLTFLMLETGADIAPWLKRPAIERGPWSGAVTTNSAVVKAKLRREGATARLLVSRSSGLSKPLVFGPATADAARGRVVAFDVTGLPPDTEYHYALEVDGVVQRDLKGRFRTFPAGPASFTFAFASCGRTGSTNRVFDVIRGHRPLFYQVTGDFHYEDINLNLPGLFRYAYDRILASPQQARLYREIPINYVWDDHDYGGNDSGGAAESRPAARRVYEDYMPHYPLPFAGPEGPIAHSFNVGRVKFLVTDLRSQRDPAAAPDGLIKSMLGYEQKAWLKRELLAAKDHHPLIFWVSSVPWIGNAATNFYPVPTNFYGVAFATNYTPVVQTNLAKWPFARDDWSAFETERREIADFIKANAIPGVVILHGDAHSLAADDGTHSDYATGGGAAVPVLAGAPLDQNPSIKGGPYSHGAYRRWPGEGCFGLVTVTDKGGEIRVRYSGRTSRNQEKIRYDFTVPAL